MPDIKCLLFVYFIGGCWALSFEEEATLPTCNLSETIHNKWIQTSGWKMADVYHATVDDFAQAALQSLFYFNYLRGGPVGTGLSKSELQLCLASKNGNSKKVVKLLDNVAVEAGLNTRILHLEDETIFGSAKWKLDLPLGDDSDSHRHDQVNYSIPKLGKGVSPSQVRLFGRSSYSLGQRLSFVNSCNPFSIS